jgi:hypothetical protein
VTRNRGNRAPHWVAAYLRPWWPSAEPTPNGRPGRDILGTPGAAIEIKTGVEWRHAWLKQAASYAGDGEVAILLYLPPGVGEKHVGEAMTILPLRVIMPLLVAAGYAPAPITERTAP